jgi:site-specific DNA-methyltransferase (adenine-specific)
MTHQILIGDCRDALKSVEAKSVHLVVTSPPYNLNIEYGKHKDSMPFDQYMEFTKEWLRECYRVLRDDGRICVNMPIYTHKKLQRNLLMAYHEGMTKIGFVEREMILWVKKFQSGIGRGKVYGTWNPANPRMHYPCEAILVMNKRDAKLKGSRSDIKAWELRNWRRNVWFITPEKDRSHPAPFPEELPRRLIKFFSFVGQTVVDPFLGSGTTMKVACELNRKCMGIELDEQYLEMIKKKVGFNGKDFVVSYPKKRIGNPKGEERKDGLCISFDDAWEVELDRSFGDRILN